MKIQIKNINGEPVGREVNPHWDAPLDEDDPENIYDAVSSLIYQKFERTVTYHPAPGCEESDGVEAVLVWQYKPYDDRYNFTDCSDDLWETKVPNAFQTRQIWRLSPSQKIEVKEVSPDQQLLDQSKKQVIERHFKHNCDYGFKQKNVNRFIRMAFENGFENGMNYQKYSNHPDTKK